MNILVNFFFRFGYSMSYKFIDRGIFELLGPTGLSFMNVGLGSNLYRSQTGYMYHYTYSILVSFTVLLALRFFWLLFFMDYRLSILFFISILLIFTKLSLSTKS